MSRGYRRYGWGAGGTTGNYLAEQPTYEGDSSPTGSRCDFCNIYSQRSDLKEATIDDIPAELEEKWVENKYQLICRKCSNNFKPDKPMRMVIAERKEKQKINHLNIKIAKLFNLDELNEDLISRISKLNSNQLEKFYKNEEKKKMRKEGVSKALEKSDYYELFSYFFEGETELDETLIKFLKTLRSKKINNLEEILRLIDDNAEEITKNTFWSFEGGDVD